MQNKPFKVVSLFSGCGGLDLGLEGDFTFLGKRYKRNSFEVIWANDIDKKATETQKLNFPKTEVVCGDVTKILQVNDGSDVDLFSNRIKIPKADVVVGGFPCQDFSLAGKRQGLGVKRGQLYLSMVKVIEDTKPKVFLAENVKGLLSWENGLGIRTIVDDFAKIGYDVEYRLLNTADFGVPQRRERVIIIGVRKNAKLQIKWANPTHSDKGKQLKPWMTLQEAIGDLENEDYQKTLPNFGYSKAKLTPGRQGNNKTKADMPGPTMRAEHHGNIEFHYKLPRRLSVREAARIQSFPDSFVFVSSITDAYRQIGNAVAPVFGWHLAQMLEDILNGD